ncbi:hypothetical protein RB653_010407 [Dictyostelium firmibasis]|uniref:non-specific serine/threonine protein kinase n=1 Tax=Dictyostelium firmibasis TaxID=79012 RepID=A0AAN7YPS3_9MYCE
MANSNNNNNNNNNNNSNGTFGYSNSECSGSSGNLLMTLDPDNNQSQLEEIECLKSIYRDEFEELPTEAVCRRFKITLIPHPTGQYQNYCAVRLYVKYSPNYPVSLPTIDLEKIRGLSDDLIEELSILLSQKMVPGEIIIFELCQAIQEFLLLYNKETVSLHQEMIKRLKTNNTGLLDSEDDNIGESDDYDDSDDENSDSDDYDDSDDENSDDEYYSNDEGFNNNKHTGDISSSVKKIVNSIDHTISHNTTGNSNKPSSPIIPHNFSFDSLNGLDSDSIFEDGIHTPLKGSSSIDFEEMNNINKNKNKESIDTGNIKKDNEISNDLMINDTIPKIKWKKGNCIDRKFNYSVYKGVNEETDKELVCKIIKLNIDDRSSSSSLTSNNLSIDVAELKKRLTEKVKMIQKEIESMKYLGNPYIIKYLGSNFQEGQNTLYIFQEYNSTQTLQNKLLSNRIGFEESQVKKFTYQLLLGLLYLHSQQIPHRDFKSHNILFDQLTSRMLLSNYGGRNIRIFDHLEKLNSLKNLNSWISTNNNSNGVIGNNINQNQINNEVDRREDIINLGIVVLEMLCGSDLANNQTVSMYLAQLNLLNNHQQQQQNQHFIQPPPLQYQLQQQYDLIKEIEQKTHPSSPISNNAKDFLSLCFTINGNGGSGDRLEAGILLKHPFLASNSNSTPPPSNFLNFTNNIKFLDQRSAATQALLSSPSSLIPQPIQTLHKSPPTNNNINNNLLASSNELSSSNSSNIDIRSTNSSIASNPLATSSSLENITPPTSRPISPKPSPLNKRNPKLPTTQQKIPSSPPKTSVKLQQQILPPAQVSANTPTTTTTATTTTGNTTTTPVTPTTPTTPLTPSQKQQQIDYDMFRYHSRYRTDFEEIEMIGKGGFGVVVKSRNKLDCRYYAIKKIKTKGYTDSDQEPLTNKLLREVTTLSRLHHQFVVRYYQAWIEKSYDNLQSLDEGNEDLSGDLETDASEDWFMQSSINSRSIISRDSYSGLSTSNSNIGGGVSAANSTAGGCAANSSKSMIVGNSNKKLTLSSSNSNGTSNNKNLNTSKSTSTSTSASTNTNTSISTSTSTSNNNKNKKNISKKKKSKSSPLIKSKNSKSKKKNDGESEQSANSSSDSENGESGMKSRIIDNGSDSYSDDNNNNDNYQSGDDNESDSFSGSISISDGNGSGYEASDQEDIINNRSFDEEENEEEDDEYEEEEEEDDYETFDFQEKSRVVSNNSKLSTASSKKKPPKETHTLYIQMEYCSKKTLKTLIDNVGGIPEDEAFRLLRQIVEGLSHIHNQQIIHRDLKPANIFIDNEQNVKIGDFGLATSGAPVSKSDDLNSSTSGGSSGNNGNINLSSSTNSTTQQTPMWDLNDENLSMTGGVGTPFYCCPEILEKNTKHYGTKVDMYSLGIIFFEMCFQFQTQMERSNILRDLRDNLKFPPGFESTKPDQTQIIRSLLSRDPNQRPSTKQLLESGLLPSKMEDDILKEAIKTIANPTISLFSYLMEKLFCLSSDEHIMSKYLYTSNPLLTPMHLICRERTFSRLENIFINHGALRIDTPTFFPKDPTNATHPGVNNVAKFLDESGTVVHLPYDLTVPWARHVVIHGIQQSKRFTFSKVYRRSQPGFSPKELNECDFDIIGPSKSRHVNDAETLRIIVEIMEEFKDELIGVNFQTGGNQSRLSNANSGSGGLNYKIRVNHYSLLDSVLSECGVEKRFYTIVYQTVAQLHWKLTWGQVAQSLKEYGLSASIVSNLSTYFRQKGDLSQCVSQLESLLVNHKEAAPGIADLKALVRNLQMINIIPKFSLDLSLVHNYQYYDGIVFQAYIERPTQSNPLRTEIIMAGGRYDKLIKSLHPNPNLSNNNVCGVGVTIACEKIVNSVLNYQQQLLNNHNNSYNNRRNRDYYTNNNYNSNIFNGNKFQSHIEVFICSLGSSMLTEKLQVASQLWSVGIKVDYSQIDYSSSEDIYTHCRQNGIPWVVLLKDKSFQNGTLKVKNIESRQETTIPRKDLVDHILKSKKLKLITDSNSKNMLHNTSSSDLSNLIGSGGGGGGGNTGGSDHHHHGHHQSASGISSNLNNSNSNSGSSNTQQTSPVQHHVHFSNTKSVIGSSGIISNSTFSGGGGGSGGISSYDESSDLFNIQIVYQSIEEIKKSKIDILIQSQLSKLFRGFIQTKSSTVRVIVTDLAHSVIKDLQISESHDNISKFQRVNKEKLLQLKTQILKWKVYPFIVIYSIKDDKSIIFNSFI